MEGSTPDWAETEDYATLEEVFSSRTFGQPLPEVAAAAVPVTAASGGRGDRASRATAPSRRSPWPPPPSRSWRPS